MSDPTKARAESIYQLSSDAADLLHQASLKLEEAVALSKGDFEYNDRNLIAIAGTVRLAAGSTSVESTTWADYARNRQE